MSFPQAEPILNCANNKVFDEATVQKALKDFYADGCLVLKDVFSETAIRYLRDGLLERRQQILSLQAKHGNNQNPERMIFPLEVNREFNVEWLYANPLVFQFLSIFFPHSYLTISAYYGVVASSGASDSRNLLGHGDLFSRGEMALLSSRIPSFEISLIAPLESIGKNRSAIRYWRGSHLLNLESRALLSDENDHVDIECDAGDCLLIDSRVRHKYLANNSDQVASSIVINYSLPWFRNIETPCRRPPFSITQEDFDALPNAVRFLFDHARGKALWFQRPQPNIPTSLLAAVNSD